MTRPPSETAAAYAEDEQRIGLSRIRIGCILAMVVLPAGSLVDWFMYPERIGSFFVVRLVGALAMLPLLVLVSGPMLQRFYRSVGVLLAMMPAASMAWIIHEAGGAESPYYAGLNLVLLAIGLVLQWNLVQSLVAVALVLAMYLAAVGGVPPPPVRGVFVNNLWFLFLTGIIVVMGNHIQSMLRWSDFAARFELDQNRKTLEATNQRLRELDELKGRFFANISHELRTPLTLLLGPLETLRARAPTADPQFRDLVDTMHNNGMRLLKLINDLLDLVRLDAGGAKLQPTHVPIEEFLRGLLNAVRRFAEDRGLALNCEISPELTVVHADPDKLEKVFLNLLFNAVKFTPAGGRITLRARREGDEAVFEVSDTGMGIAPEHLPHLFSRFWQADSSAQRKFQGAGIGLALVKELVLLHRGSVRAESQSGAGTTMIVRIPVGPAPAAAPVPAGGVSAPTDRPAAAAAVADEARRGDQGRELWLASLYRRAELFSNLVPLRESLRPWTPGGSHQQRPRLLIADDEPDMLRFLKLQLEEDYEILEAVDGEQAAAMACQYLPDLILCDMMLPEKDGVQVCRELRANPSTRSIPFVMLTARADDETKLQALSAGASDFLSKPFSTTELRVRLKNLVDNYQLQRALAWQNQKLEATLQQLKETELQLVQSEKMASLGRMSAGIIHEINNPLNFTRTGLYTLAAYGPRLPEGARAEFEDTLRDLGEGVSRIASIVSDLRTFTHPQASVREEVNVALTAGAALRFLAGEWRERVTVVNEIPEDFAVRASRSKLIQVFVNLMQNSLDALKEKQFAGESPTLRLRAEVRGDAKVLTIWDNGNGIAEAHLGKVFEPFFTTKEVGQGTGLGLSIVYRLMNEFGGRVVVRSEPGRFCEFALEFPGQVSDKNEVARAV
ncbi:MAG TPA: ATP-binding protein [Verrucomicrobiota bacterium]|nr:ATP-binding protein [Verrucomicrobiota bacterium]HNU49563.1 ATP-binding protein [Verrucomicrobiota bacterium]